MKNDKSKNIETFTTNKFQPIDPKNKNNNVKKASKTNNTLKSQVSSSQSQKPESQSKSVFVDNKVTLSLPELLK